MTAVSVELAVIDDWKNDLRHCIRRSDELLDVCELDQSAFPALNQLPDFPLRVSRHYASLIERSNPDDPLLRQVLPELSESETQPGYQPDAVGDLAATPTAGLIHKYKGRALLTVSAACAIHCRYCFRQHFPYSENPVNINPGGPILSYLEKNNDIREVILSGGDPLMLDDPKLSEIISALNQCAQVKTLRIHTRMVTTLPSRVTKGFVDTLRQFNGRIIIVNHCNHANEIDPTNSAALKALRLAGFYLLNQSVLLRNINDNPEALAELSETLFDQGVLPYYLHCLDHVNGNHRFDVDLDTATAIHQELACLLPGYLVPRLVKEYAGDSAKRAVF